MNRVLCKELLFTVDHQVIIVSGDIGVLFVVLFCLVQTERNLLENDSIERQAEGGVAKELQRPLEVAQAVDEQLKASAHLTKVQQ